MSGTHYRPVSPAAPKTEREIKRNGNLFIVSDPQYHDPKARHEHWEIDEYGNESLVRMPDRHPSREKRVEGEKHKKARANSPLSYWMDNISSGSVTLGTESTHFASTFAANMALLSPESKIYWRHLELRHGEPEDITPPAWAGARRVKKGVPRWWQELVDRGVGQIAWNAETLTWIYVEDSSSCKYNRLSAYADARLANRRSTDSLAYGPEAPRTAYESYARDSERKLAPYSAGIGSSVYASDIAPRSSPSLGNDVPRRTPDMRSPRGERKGTPDSSSAGSWDYLSDVTLKSSPLFPGSRHPSSAGPSKHGSDIALRYPLSAAPPPFAPPSCAPPSFAPPSFAGDSTAPAGVERKGTPYLKHIVPLYRSDIPRCSSSLTVGAPTYSEGKETPDMHPATTNAIQPAPQVTPDTRVRYPPRGAKGYQVASAKTLGSIKPLK